MFDVITMGSATRDIFIETDKAQIMSIKNIEEKQDYYCLGYGDKIEVDQSCFEIGGGGVNTAVNLANMGLKTSAVVKIGDGFNSDAVLCRLADKKVDASLVIRTKEHRTGFSVILTSFEGDRTVLAHRGANRTIVADEINWEVLKQTKWIYIAPLSNESNVILDDVVKFAKENGVKTAYNPGGTDMKRGLEGLEPVLRSVNLIVLNKSEASKLTGIIEKTETKHDVGNGKPINSYVKEMLLKLKEYGPDTIVITDGKNGVTAYDGNGFYFAPQFPAKVLSTLGAGDAFSSTFVGTLIKCDCDMKKSVALASINAASVVEKYSAQAGLKTYEELETVYDNNPDYRAVKYSIDEV